MNGEMRFLLGEKGITVTNFQNGMFLNTEHKRMLIDKHGRQLGYFTAKEAKEKFLTIKTK